MGSIIQSVGTRRWTSQAPSNSRQKQCKRCRAPPLFLDGSTSTLTSRAGTETSFNGIESLSAVIGFHLRRPTEIPKVAGVSVMLAERALWHRERIASALIVSLILLGCGGKAADPIPQYQPGDEARSCSGLKAEIANNEAEIAKLLPSEDATGKNVALGVAGVFLIVPWFFMDFKEGEATEIKALRRRNQWLREAAANKNCEVPPSKFLVQDKPCSAAAISAQPWIGTWNAKTAGDLLAVDLTQYQINGQLITQSGTFEVNGRVENNGVIEATIKSSWANGTLRGAFPTLNARATGDSQIGSITASQDTQFVLCK